MRRRDRWGRRVLRGLAIGLGAVFAWGLMWVGCELWGLEGGRLPLGVSAFQLGPMAAVVPWSAGLFIWMFLVSDDLCPRGARRVGGPVKAVTVAVLLIALVSEAAWHVW